MPAPVADRRRAGIRIIVISGDDGLAARAREAGIVGEHAPNVTGPELDAISDDAATRCCAARRS